MLTKKGEKLCFRSEKEIDMSKKTLTPAFSYLRLSGLSQVDGDGLTRQRLTIDTFAKKNKYKIEAEFSDAGVTGTIVDRPALTALLNRIASDHLDVEIPELLKDYLTD